MYGTVQGVTEKPLLKKTTAPTAAQEWTVIAMIKTITKGLEVFDFTCTPICEQTCPLCKCKFEYTDDDIICEYKYKPWAGIAHYDTIKVVECPQCQKRIEHKL